MPEDGLSNLSDKDCDGPCRETAHAMLDRAIQATEEKLKGLRHLRQIAANIEAGSPAEVALWKIMQEAHRYLNP